MKQKLLVVAAVVLAALIGAIGTKIALLLTVETAKHSVAYYEGNEKERTQALFVCVFESQAFDSSMDCLNAKEAEDNIRRQWEASQKT